MALVVSSWHPEVRIWECKILRGNVSHKGSTGILLKGWEDIWSFGAGRCWSTEICIVMLLSQVTCIQGIHFTCRSSFIKACFDQYRCCYSSNKWRVCYANKLCKIVNGSHKLLNWQNCLASAFLTFAWPKDGKLKHIVMTAQIHH